MAQVDAGVGRYELFHYRDREKREIDFLIEREDNALLGIEVKAGSAVAKEDFRHMRWFRKNREKTGHLSASFSTRGNSRCHSATTFGRSPLVLIHDSKKAGPYKITDMNLKPINF